MHKTGKQTEFNIRTYNNGFLHVVLGRTYGGEGYSGMTDGVDVRGKATEIDMQRDSVIIFRDKLNMPCAVKLRFLYAL
jgi:hypothetical protein